MSDAKVEALVISTLCAVGLLVAKEVFSFFRSGQSENTRALEKNREAMGDLGKAVVKLQCQIETLNKNIEILPKLGRDVDAAHSAIREMRASQEA